MTEKPRRPLEKQELETFDMTHSTSRRQMLSQGAALVGAASTGLLLPQSVLAHSG